MLHSVKSSLAGSVLSGQVFELALSRPHLHLLRSGSLAHLLGLLLHSDSCLDGSLKLKPEAILAFSEVLDIALARSQHSLQAEDFLVPLAGASLSRSEL